MIPWNKRPFICKLCFSGPLSALITKRLCLFLEAWQAFQSQPNFHAEAQGLQLGNPNLFVLKSYPQLHFIQRTSVPWRIRIKAPLFYASGWIMYFHQPGRTWKSQETMHKHCTNIQMSYWRCRRRRRHPHHHHHHHSRRHTHSALPAPVPNGHPGDLLRKTAFLWLVNWDELDNLISFRLRSRNH